MNTKAPYHSSMLSTECLTIHIPVYHMCSIHKWLVDICICLMLKNQGGIIYVYVFIQFLVFIDLNLVFFLRDFSGEAYSKRSNIDHA